MRHSDESPPSGLNTDRSIAPWTPSCTESWGPILEAMVAEETERAALPHVVVVHDPYLDRPHVFGPFPSPVGALKFAERCTGELLYGDYVEPIRTEVVALEPAS